MFVNFRFLSGVNKKKNVHDTHELTLENANLAPGQIANAKRALRFLGFEPKLDKLSRDDFINFFYAMGMNPTDDIVESKLRAFKLHQRKTFTFGQLVHVWNSLLQDHTDEDEILQRAFQFFDKDGNGEISVQELRTTMHELGDLLTEDEINAFMRIMDVNNDGAIGYNEFLATLKTQATDLTSGEGGSGGPAVEEMQGAGGGSQQEEKGQGEPAATTPGVAGSSRTEGLNGSSEPQSLQNRQPSQDRQPLPNRQPSQDQQPLPNRQLSQDRQPTGHRPAMMSSFIATAEPPISAATEWGRGVSDETSPTPQPPPQPPPLPPPLPPLPPTSRSQVPSGAQLQSFAPGRPVSLKAGKLPPPPAAPEEPLLAHDAVAPAAAPPLSRQSSQPRNPPDSRALVSLRPGPEHAGSARRFESTALSESGFASGTGAGTGDPGEGLRAPSTLDTAPGSDGS